MDITNRTPRRIKCIGNSNDVIHGYYSHLLQVGKVYNLTGLEVYNWHTDVYLREFPTHRFNSVLFEEL